MLDRIVLVCHRSLELVAAALAAIVVAFPALAASAYIAELLLGWDPRTLLTQGLEPLKVMAYVAASGDSGGQLFASSSLLRTLLLTSLTLWLLLPRLVPTHLRRGAPWLLGGAALGLIAALACSHRADALVSWMELIAALSLLFVIADLGGEERNWYIFVGLGLTLLALLLATAYISFGVAPEPDMRMRGSFHHPNILGGYLLLFLPLLTALVLREKESTLMEFNLMVLFAATVTALLLTRSRAAILGALLSCGPVLAAAGGWDYRQALKWILAWSISVSTVFVAFFFEWTWLAAPALLAGVVLLALAVKERLRLPDDGALPLCIKLFLAGALLLLAGASFDINPLNRVVNAGSSGSFAARIAFWKAATQMAFENPVLGIGPEGFRRVYPRHQQDLRYFSKFAHSLPLTLAAEFGIPCLILLCGFYYHLTRSLWEQRHQLHEPLLRLALWLGATAFLFQASLDVHFQFPALVAACSFIVGLAAAGARIPQAEGDSQWSVRPSLLLQYLLAAAAILMTMFSMKALFGSHYATVARTASTLGRHEEAAKLLREAVFLDPSNAEHHRLLGLALLQLPERDQKTQEELLREAQAAVSLDPGRSVVYSLLGRTLKEMGQDPTQAFAEALRLDPINYPSFYREYAETLWLSGQRAEAIEFLEQARQKYPDGEVEQVMEFRLPDLKRQLSQLDEVLGFFYLEKPVRSDQAEKAFRRALYQNPDSPDARFGLAVILLERAHYEEAEELLLEVTAKRPHARAAWEVLGEVYRRQNKQTEFEGIKQKLIELDRSEPAPPLAPESTIELEFDQ